MTAEPGERSLRVKLVSFLMLGIVVTVKIILSDHLEYYEVLVKFTYPFLPAVINLLLDGSLVVALTFFLAETRFLKSYVEERLHATQAHTATTFDEHATKFLREDFTIRAVNLDFLRGFSHSFLKLVSSSVRRAFFVKELPQEMESLLDVLATEREIPTLWRTNYRAEVVYQDIPDRPELRILMTKFQWTFVNYSNETKTIEQRLSEIRLRVAGIDQSELCKFTEINLGGEDYLQKLKVQTKDIDTRIKFEVTFPLTVQPTTLEKKGIVLSRTTESIQPKTEPLVMTFFRPVYGLALSLHHPISIHPLMYIFSVGIEEEAPDPLQPKEHTGTYTRWEYNGWFLPDHGFILIFSEHL